MPMEEHEGCHVMTLTLRCMLPCISAICTCMHASVRCCGLELLVDRLLLEVVRGRSSRVLHAMHKSLEVSDGSDGVYGYWDAAQC